MGGCHPHIEDIRWYNLYIFLTQNRMIRFLSQAWFKSTKRYQKIDPLSNAISSLKEMRGFTFAQENEEIHE